MICSWDDVPYDVLEAFCKEAATRPHPPSSSNSSRQQLVSETHKTLLALSLVDSRTREACYPHLFNKLTFMKTCSDKLPTWAAYDERMKHIISNAAMCRAIRIFELASWINDIENHRPTPATYQLFPRFLASLPLLHTLNFRLQDPFVPEMRSAFSDVLQTCGPLRQVKKLNIALSCHFLVQHCPNIREFEEKRLYRDEAVNAMTWVKPLGTFCVNLVGLSTWEPIGSVLLRSLLEYLPRLEALNLMGGVCFRGNVDPEDHGNTEGIMSLLPKLGKLQRLRKLILPDSSSLGIGIEVPICGNAFLEDPEYAAQWDREAEEASARVSVGAQNHCLSVMELWVGYLYYERDQRGIISRSQKSSDDRVLGIC
ncbi:hypothetical protein JAAARDRAFT_32162 [Jaapia argillacea MUCL 33604]|uniref:F-box domain-containing protein n=1 Tax=Jaapia argillacea MUCL 33604 TaxID=933084 RepID=A0A067QCC8_9AGAM|nr:hypothetical protein JAAARDRAFT_32162 [Jaapia argillacea MUCL 33604]